MNSAERRMVDVLKDLRDSHHVVGVKAEFEAEGTRMEEAYRLKEVVSKADLDLTIKIGGCEALKDLYEARVIGVSRIVAPMIESEYALRKYLTAARLAFPEDERKDVAFLINIETTMGYERFDAMLALPELGELSGIVLGRVDMTGSLGMNRDDINHPRIQDLARSLFERSRLHGLECVIGGGVAAESLPFFRSLGPALLDHYETRKVIFQCPDALGDDAERGILKAVGFELMWLKSKRDFYGMIFQEDRVRIDMLQSRYDRLIKEAGGRTD